MLLKTIKYRECNLVQVPKFVVEKWGLGIGDGLEVYISDDEGSVIIKPRKGLIKVSKGSRLNEGSESLVKESIVYKS